jgi:2-dehydropantoate 2-reductase
MSAPAWPRVAIVGAGAVGGYFGGMLARSGASVVMIGRGPFVNAVGGRGLDLDTIQFREFVRVDASTELSAVRDAGLVLFCTKTVDTIATARAMTPHLSPTATVVSLQNGVDNAARIRATTGIDVMPAVVYVAASMPAPGHIKHIARGDLVVGPSSDRAQGVASVFERAGVPCRISDNIEGELWTKLIWNCALNSISALGRARYGQIAKDAAAWSVVESVVREVLEVAEAAGIVLPEVHTLDQAMQGTLGIATAMRDAFSSTAQDIARGKITEIDSLNGYIARRGAEIGVATPVNRALYALVKLLEQQ